MATVLSYEEKMFRDQARHYMLCMDDNCSRKEHYLRRLVAQCTPGDLHLVNVTNPYR